MAGCEQHVELGWLLPPQSISEKPGQYEITLAAGKRTAQDELLEVAQSVKV